MAQMVFNERLSNQLEVVYHARDMVRRRELAREALAATEGERVLHIGCGPGFFVAELLGEVGPDGHVSGVDASPDEAAAWSAEQRQLDADGEFYFTCTQFCFTATRPEG